MIDPSDPFYEEKMALTKCPWTINSSAHPGFLDFESVAEAATTRPIKLIVGPAKKVLWTLEGHLYNVKFFGGALFGQFKERDGTIEMPEDDPTAVSCLLTWLVKGFGQPQPWRSMDGSLFILNLVPLATKLCMPELLDECYRCIWEYTWYNFKRGEYSHFMAHYKSLGSLRSRFLLIHIAVAYRRHEGGEGFDARMLMETTDAEFWNDYANYKIIFYMAIACTAKDEERGESRSVKASQLIFKILDGSFCFRDLPQDQFARLSEVEKVVQEAKFDHWYQERLDI